MDRTPEQVRQDALAFLKHHNAGVLATLSPEGGVHASTVYYTCDDNFNIYILTLTSSRKYTALVTNPKVAFTVFYPEVPQTLQLEGVAMDISLDEEAAKKRDELFAVLNANNWFYGPITKLDLSDTAIIWLKPSWVRWADYAFADAGSEHVLKEIPLP